MYLFGFADLTTTSKNLHILSFLLSTEIRVSCNFLVCSFAGFQADGDANTSVLEND
jgi:hypothetical protein